MDYSLIQEMFPAITYLHSNHSIDEEDHSNKKSNIRQGLRDKKNNSIYTYCEYILNWPDIWKKLSSDLKRFHKGPEKRTNTLSFA